MLRPEMMPYVAMGAMGTVLIAGLAFALGVWAGIRIEDRWDIDSGGYNYRRRGPKAK